MATNLDILRRLRERLDEHDPIIRRMRPDNPDDGWVLRVWRDINPDAEDRNGDPELGSLVDE